MKMKLFFLVFFLVFSSITWYVFLRGWQAIPNEQVFHIIYTTVFLICSFSFFISYAFEKKLHRKIIEVYERIGGFWMIALMYFVAMAAFGDLLRLADYLFGIFPDQVTSNYPSVKLMYFGLVIFILILFSVIGYFNFKTPAIVKLNLKIPKRNSEIKNLSVVAVSDVHLGDLIHKKRLESYVDMINHQNPDIILIAGDLFDRNMHSVKRQGMDKILKTLKAKYGVYAILGNHEYIGNVGMAVDIISDSGIHLLRDSAVTIDNKITLVGRDDLMNKKRKPLKTVMLEVADHLPVILLDHQPVNLSETAANNIDLQISGHTHNGQIYPFNHVVSLFYEMVYGYKKIDNTHFYVSSGLGLWGAPIRLGTQSEIVCIEIEFVG